jgi:hypothetical protein
MSGEGFELMAGVNQIFKPTLCKKFALEFFEFAIGKI